MFTKSIHDKTVVSEINNLGVTAKEGLSDFNINEGCAGLAFKSKEPIFEPFAQSSMTLSRQELDPEIFGTVVQNLIAIPIFDEDGESIGIFEALNCEKSIFSAGIKPLLVKVSKFVSLLFYTNTLLKVFIYYP